MVTMRDVADAAGVSVATVSRVVNGNRPVNADTEREVERAIADLGYRPNHLASALRRQRTRSVAMVVPHISNPFFPRLVEAVERALAADAHQLLLADSHDDATVERDRIQALLERQIDGLLLVPCHERDSATVLASLDVPHVLLDRTVTGDDSDHVVIDDVMGMRAVLDHLRACGYRRFAYVGAVADSSTARTRLETFRAEAGPDAPVLLRDFSMEWGREAAGRLLDDGLPEAIVASNDLTAIGVIRGLRDAGVELSRDVAVTGYDDIGFAEVSHPSLTTVRQPVDEMGQAAVGLLLDRLHGRDPAERQLVLSPRLIVRESTGGVRS